MSEKTKAAIAAREAAKVPAPAEKPKPKPKKKEAEYPW